MEARELGYLIGKIAIPILIFWIAFWFGWNRIKKKNKLKKITSLSH